MRISLNWLKEYVDIDLTVDELARELTMLGLEIESVETPGEDIQNVKVGKILSIDPHPDADKLVVCKTDVGEGDPLQIVCGAKNMKPGDLVPTAVVGATLPGGFAIGRRKMRGVESQGMMCSTNELGLGDDGSGGLMILDPSTPIGQDIKPLLGLDDVIMEIEVTPNRADWAGMIGVARELAALLGKELRLPDTSLTEDTVKAADLSSVTIEDPDLCPRYAGRVLTDVTVGPSPAWICQRLIAGGVRPINNIVDITNYVLLETGHPLHAFDYDKLGENRIVVRRARDGEKIVTLDEDTRSLTSDMLVIADANEPVAVAGIMGGHDSEVGESTTRIFLESAYFLPASVRATARALGMQTEASSRFQRGADPEMAILALERAAKLMQELTGAKIAQGQLDEYPAPLTPREVTLRYARADALLGAEISSEEQCSILERLGFELINKTADACTARVPLRRHDVALEADLIEEVARLHGYGNFPSSLPAVRKTEDVFAPQDAKIRTLRHFLASQGLTELMSMTFASEADIDRAAMDPALKGMVMLQNPMSENQAGMRTTLVPGLLAAAAKNARHQCTHIAAFEVGPVYKPNDSNELPDQGQRLGIVLSGSLDPQHWSRDQVPADFYDLKGYAENVLDLWTTDYRFEPVQAPFLDPAQSAAIVTAGGKPLGHLGAASAKALRNNDMEQPVYLLELDLDLLLAHDRPEPRFETIPPFPPALRDMAVLVAAATPAGDLLQAAQKAGGKHLKRVDIFDVYTGKQVPAGKKSVALSLVFQSPERTLTDRQTQKAWDNILKTLQRDFKAELR